MSAIIEIDKSSTLALQNAQASRDKVNGAQELLRTTTADIEVLIQGVKDAADTNLASARMVAELEKQADVIGEIVQSVVGIAKQPTYWR